MIRSEEPRIRALVPLFAILVLAELGRDDQKRLAQPPETQFPGNSGARACGARLTLLRADFIDFILERQLVNGH